MKKLEFLVKGKAFLRTLAAYMLQLINQGVPMNDKEWVEHEIANIKHAVEAISTYDNLARYILRKSKDLEILIPNRNINLRAKLEVFLDEARAIVTHEEMVL